MELSRDISTGEETLEQLRLVLHKNYGQAHAAFRALDRDKSNTIDLQEVSLHLRDIGLKVQPPPANPRDQSATGGGRNPEEDTLWQRNHGDA